MSIDNIEEVLNKLLTIEQENEIVEFKKASDNQDFKKIGQYFSALSNEANLNGKKRAWLIFGVNNKKRVVGTNFRKSRSSLHALKKDIADHTTHRVTFTEIHELNREGNRVIMFEIPPAPPGVPVPFQGHFYGREGESLGALSLEEQDRIRAQQNIKDWSAELCSGAQIGDLSEKAIQKALENYAIKNPRISEEIHNWSTEKFLTKAKLLKDDKPTNTAILLLGKPESSIFLSPTMPQITWVLYDKDKMEKDYEHFKIPFILAIDKVYAKIRNLKYRYIKEETLFPEEVDQFDPQNIREALSNCIAHMDYNLGGRINVAEREDGYLSFSNPGSFLPASIENVIKSDEPPTYYRNKLLAETMVAFNMIDSIGSGIKRMFKIQSERFFPMPEYDLRQQKVKVTLIGKVLDMNYARMLALNKNLNLNEIFLLDKVQKGKKLLSSEIEILKAKQLIEGRKPNFHISARIAKTAALKADYVKQRGIEDDYCQKIILDYLAKFNKGERKDFEAILLDKLPDVLSMKQKKDKVKNNLQNLRRAGKIQVNKNRYWVLSKTNEQTHN